MTFDQIVQRIASRLNLTSSSAISRIGEDVNDLYKEVTASVGLDSSVRGVASTTTTTDSRYITFGDDDPDSTDARVIKVLAVFLPDQPIPWNVLGESTFDELRNVMPVTWPARRWAVSNMGPASVRLFLDATGVDDTTEVQADVLMASDTLVDDAQPNFTENFHDILVYGGMAIELDKMEKTARAERMQKKYETRLSQLRLHIAESAYLRIHQGKNEYRWTQGLNTGSMVIEPSSILALGDSGDADVPLLVDDDGVVQGL
jgi:hypothetical protein